MNFFLQGLTCASLLFSLSCAGSQRSVFADPEAAIGQLDRMLAEVAWFPEYNSISTASLRDQKALLQLDMYKAKPVLRSFYLLRLMLMGEAEDSLSQRYQKGVREYQVRHSAVLYAIQTLGQSDDGTPGAYQKSLYRLLNGLSRPQPQKPVNTKLLADLLNSQSGLNATALFQLMAANQLKSVSDYNIDMESLSSDEAVRINALTRSLLDGQPRGESFYQKNNWLKSDALLPEFLLTAFTNLVTLSIPGFSDHCLTQPSDCFWQNDGNLHLYKVIITSLSLSHWPLRGPSAADALLSAVKDIEETRGCLHCNELDLTKQFIHQLSGNTPHNNHNEL